MTYPDLPILHFGGTVPGGQVVPVSLRRLMTGRLLVQAGSGGGKSQLLRSMCEQTWGLVQHIIIDPEGEYATLRERFPYLLAGGDGDVEAHPASAAGLARQTMQHQLSLIIDVSDLPLPQSRAFVGSFLATLIGLPKELRRATLVFIDEAHLFAPQAAGDAESTAAVIDLVTRGRKRNLGTVIATQRLAKLHKDAADLHNNLIGYTALDIDVNRAGDMLGMTKEDRQGLKQLQPGQFYAYGPAISRTVVLAQSGPVTTTHPQPGELAPPAPPAPEAIARILAEIGELPRASTATPTPDDPETQRYIAHLEQQLKAAKAPQPERIEVPVDVPVITPDQLLALDAAVAPLVAALARIQAPAAAQPAKPRSATTRTPSGAPTPTAPTDEIGDVLRIPAVAAKLARVRERFKYDTAAQGYIVSTLRLLWRKTLRPGDIAEGRGAASKRTISRREAVCAALAIERLLIKKNGTGYTVNHVEVNRLKQLAEDVK